MKIYKKCINNLNANIKKLDKTISDLKSFNLILKISTSHEDLD